ncbi:MAG: hypothetical protein RQ715_07255 [Methylococcales bacterium]|nr:hypothetical protein [Methylococcales bacterium]
MVDEGHLSLAAAAALLGVSERTVRRRLVEGVLQGASGGSGRAKSVVALASLKPYLAFAVTEAEGTLLVQADAGQAEAQVDLALWLLAKDQAPCAVYWLQRAASQESADAMHVLSECYLQGQGVAVDQNRALLWLAHAAVLGHPIAQAQVQGMRFDQVV